MDDWGMGPCMCGGCRRCLHDQGIDCGNPDCRICAMRKDDESWEEELEDAGSAGSLDYNFDEKRGE